MMQNLNFILEKFKRLTINTSGKSCDREKNLRTQMSFPLCHSAVPIESKESERLHTV
jgi:hypothetical protein